jgi:hypothetical protein
MKKIKTKFIRSEELSNKWDKGFYSIQDVFIGVYTYKDYIICFDKFYDEKKKQLLKHISISHKTKKSLKINKEIEFIIEHFIGRSFEIEEPIFTDVVLNIYEKIVEI